MPSLSNLQCTIEIGPKNIVLREYGTTYGDGLVETYVAVPAYETAFSLYLTSKGYIAPGLAIFVFIDGVLQCNRNRRGLKEPGSNTLPSDTEIDFRVRQNERKIDSEKWIGREWSFAPINATDDTSGKDRKALRSVGTIEVVVRRCRTGLEEHTGSVKRPSGAQAVPGWVLDLMRSGTDDRSGSVGPTSDIPSSSSRSHGHAMGYDGTCDEGPHRSSTGMGNGRNRSPFGFDGAWDDGGPPPTPCSYNGEPAPSPYHFYPLPQRNPGGYLRRPDHVNSRYPYQAPAPYYPQPYRYGPPPMNDQALQQPFPYQVPPNFTGFMPPTHVPGAAPEERATTAARNENNPWFVGTLDSELRKLDNSVAKPQIDKKGDGASHTSKKDKSPKPNEQNNQELSWGNPTVDEQTQNNNDAWGATDQAKPPSATGWNAPLNDDNSNDNPGGIDSKPSDWGTGANDQKVDDKPVEQGWGTNDNTNNSKNNGWPAEGSNLDGASKAESKSRKRNDENGAASRTNQGHAKRERTSEQRNEAHQSKSRDIRNKSSSTARSDNVSLRDPYIVAEEPRKPFSKKYAEKKSLSHQVQAGKGAMYWHQTSRPVYLDTMDKPYALFRFKYRSKEVLEKQLGIKVRVEKEDFRRRVQDLSKEELIEQIMRAKKAAGYNTDSDMDDDTDDDNSSTISVASKAASTKTTQSKAENRKGRDKGKDKGKEKDKGKGKNNDTNKPIPWGESGADGQASGAAWGEGNNGGADTTAAW